MALYSLRLCYPKEVNHCIDVCLGLNRVYAEDYYKKVILANYLNTEGVPANVGALIIKEVLKASKK